MRIWILNHYGGPPGGGRFERPVYMGRAFRRAGHNCTVFYASFHHLLSSPGVSFQKSVIDGVTYLGIPCRSYRGNGFSRVANMLDFSPSVRRWMKESGCEAPDAVIVSSPHPFAFGVAGWLRRKFQCRFVFEVRDLWPESLIELAGVSRFHPFVIWIALEVQRACSNADAVVSLLPKTAENLAKKGMAEDKFHWIPNGIDVELNRAKLSVELPEVHRDAIRAVKDRGRFLIGYAGAMGPPNALDQLVALAGICRDEELPYEFLLVGDGVSKLTLESSLEELGCDFIKFLPSLKKDEVPSFLREMDANLIIWNDAPIYRFGVSPNKVSEYMLSSKPVVWVGETGNDPVAEADCGYSIKSNDAQLLKETLFELSRTTAEERDLMGTRGETFAMTHLNWERLGQSYVDLIENLVN